KKVLSGELLESVVRRNTAELRGSNRIRGISHQHLAFVVRLREIRLIRAIRGRLFLGSTLENSTLHFFPSSMTIWATRRPISTAKLVPRSHGYTWLIEAKYSPFTGVRMSGMLGAWLMGGTGWA